MSGFIPLKVTGELVSQPHLNPPKCLRGRGNQPWARLSFSILEGVSQPGIAVLQLCLPLCNAQLCPAGPSVLGDREQEAGEEILRLESSLRQNSAESVPVPLLPPELSRLS